MNDLAVRVEHLHKRYRLGSTHAHDGSLAGALSRGMRQLVGRRSAPPPTDDTLWALRYVSFEIKKGEVFGVIGRWRINTLCPASPGQAFHPSC